MTESSVAHPLMLVSHIDALPPGSRLAEFEIIGLLGVGGFGMVYQAFDHSLQRQVAIKEYMPSALAGRSRGMTVSMRSAADTQTFMAGLKSFVAEARLLAQFDHPSLVKVFRFWEANNTAYMVMPLYSGLTFKAARSHMRSPPPEAWLRKVMWSVLGALRVLHEGRTMHRDVSPDNIFLQDNGPPVLLDLGAARRAIGDKSQKHTAILKVNYAPIEQYADAEDMRQGPWTDLYSLGAVVHGCLCNEPPMPATFRVLRDRMPTFESVVQTVREQFGLNYSPEFIGAISHALAIRPEDRPQTVAEFADSMQLQTPSGMSKFDWRAELGDVYLPPDATPESAQALYSEAPRVEQLTQRISSTIPGDAAAAAGHVMPEVELPDIDEVIDETAPMMPQAQARAARTPAAAAGPAPSARERAPSSPKVPAPKRRVGVWVAAGVALAVGAGLVLALKGGAPGSEPAVAAPVPAIITEPKEEVLVPATAAVSPASAAVAPTAAASMPATAASAAAKMALNPAAPQPAASAPRKPALAVAVVPAPTPEIRPVATPTAAPVDTAAMTRPVPAPRPAASRAETGSAGDLSTARRDAELCADSNFLTRPMCLFRECQRPELANLAVCVDQKRRQQQQNTRDPSTM